MNTPRLTVDLDKLTHNVRTVAALCGRHGISVLGVVKAAAGHLEVARAFVAGGVTALGDSRLENLERLRRAGIGAELTMLRLPQPSRVADVVRLADVSLNSELSTIALLSREAERLGRRHGVVVMVDLGDLREGFWIGDGVATAMAAGELATLARELRSLSGVEVVGIGTNLTCYGGVVPTMGCLSGLVTIKAELESTLGRTLAVVSGGNTSSLPLMLEGGLPPGVNELRIGEGILLGRDTVRRDPIPGTFQDAFVLTAEVIEVKEKPSVPVGETANDAFGHKPAFADRGVRPRAILALGRQDVVPEALEPLLPGAEVLGASSDHLVVDVEDVAGGGAAVKVGDEISFRVGYGALLAAMTSPYVKKEFVGGSQAFGRE